MRILVTGASGFIGSRLVPGLLARGHQVRTFGRSPRLAGALAGLPIEHVSGDITCESAVRRAVEGCELIFHLAGLVSYRKIDRERQYQVNVTGTGNVMRSALSAGVARVIHTSSIAAMGIPAAGTTGDEELSYNLAGLGLNYCDTKHEGELEVMKYVSSGLPALILSPGIILGEGDTHPHHRAIFLAISRGWLIGCPSGGVTFCDIEDVVAAHLNAMTLGRVGHRYVLGSANLTYREAATVASRVLGCRPPAMEIPGSWLELAGSFCEAVAPALGVRPALTRQIAWLSQRRIFFSNQKAVKELNMPVTDFEQTVRRTYRYYLGLPAAGKTREKCDQSSASISS